MPLIGTVSYPSAGCDSGIPCILSHAGHHLLNRHLNEKNKKKMMHLWKQLNKQDTPSYSHQRISNLPTVWSEIPVISHKASLPVSAVGP